MLQNLERFNVLYNPLYRQLTCICKRFAVYQKGNIPKFSACFLFHVRGIFGAMFTVFFALKVRANLSACLIKVPYTQKTLCAKLTACVVLKVSYTQITLCANMIACFVLKVSQHRQR